MPIYLRNLVNKHNMVPTKINSLFIILDLYKSKIYNLITQLI